MTDTLPAALEFDLTLSDYRALLKHVGTPPARLLSPRLMGICFGIVVLGIVLVLPEVRRPLLFGVLITLVFILIVVRRTQGALVPRPNGAVLCRYQLALGNDGVNLRTPHWSSLTSWTGILAVEETVQHIFLRVDNIAAYTVPKAAFPDTASQTTFLAFAKRHLGTASDQAT